MRPTERPDIDGWHWVATPWGCEIVRYWYANRDEWSDGLGSAHSTDGWSYLARCIPPSEMHA
jgi:hypothetical protein